MSKAISAYNRFISYKMQCAEFSSQIRQQIGSKKLVYSPSGNFQSALFESDYIIKNS